MGRRKTKEEKMALAQGLENKPSTPEMQKIEKDFMDIAYYQRKQRNNLLGNFVDGKYKLSDETILQKLKEIPKKVTEIEKDVVYLGQKLNDFFVLNFKAEFDMAESYCTAKLYFIETENNMVENEKYITLLDEQVAPYSTSFKDDMLKLWHAYYGEEPLEMDDFLLSYLLMQMHDADFTREITDILSQLYVLKMLKLLQNLGDEGIKIYFEFNLNMEKYFKDYPGIKDNYILQKIILDSVLKKNNGFEVVLKNDEGKKILSEFATPLKNIRDKNVPSIVESEKPKTEEPAKTAEKPKAEKKKDDGKKKAAASKPSASKPFVYTPKGAKKEDKKDDKKKKPLPTGLLPKVPANKTNDNKPNPEQKQPQKEDGNLQDSLNKIITGTMINTENDKNIINTPTEEKKPEKKPDSLEKNHEFNR